ncbi:serine/threonine-protein kinase YabT [Bacillus sp. JCM 19046]|nr:serine/threonine-protein kinase YabT [Bacillus sp. JCM 19046]
MKMNGSTANLNQELYSGLTIEGKWNKKTYTLIRKLGEGVTGTVYLARSLDGNVALKLGMDQMSIAQEVNVLKQFSKVQGKILGPCLFDVDDHETRVISIPFYAMEYIQGVNFVTFMKNRGSEWLFVLTVQLLNRLEDFHQAGWVFGDLKPDNIIVTSDEASVRLLDVGGTTKLGRAVKEYTEYYDRGYWGRGSRKAEPSYDLFSVAMMMIDCAYPEQIKKGKGDGLSQLKRMVSQSPLLKPFKDIIVKALTGEFETAGEMRNALKGERISRKRKATISDKEVSRNQYKKVRNHHKKKARLTDLLFILAFVLLLFILYLSISLF